MRRGGYIILTWLICESNDHCTYIMFIWNMHYWFTVTSTQTFDQTCLLYVKWCKITSYFFGIILFLIIIDSKTNRQYQIQNMIKVRLSVVSSISVTHLKRKLIRFMSPPSILLSGHLKKKKKRKKEKRFMSFNYKPIIYSASFNAKDAKTN